ncbi:small RNA degrading nuclease 3-like [Bidens hawaiensis]|uniref:small RNA degrading nuclease 3-like n=1 Tax=Bidens hawaiensis TaxID=980011 RepID=UPI00404B630B
MEKIETAPKNVLVDIVRRSQKQGMRGVNGGWKEFINVYYKQLGAGWVVTNNRKTFHEPECNTILAVDCEMVLCADGTDALVRVCVVDRDLKVILDELVKPDKKVVDYRSRITGIYAKDLVNVTTKLRDVQEYMKKLLSNGAILAGHSLDSDLRALKIDHTRVIDTSFIFNYCSGPNFQRASLNNLCKAVLGSEVRKDGATHDCLDDARYAMKLVVAKLDGKGDSDMLIQVHDANAMKLLCHRIPINVSKEKLFGIIPGDYTIELKENKKGGNKYAAFLVFKSKQAADEAYERLVGDQDKDSSGRPQKRIGAFGTFFVRKMARGNNVVNNNNVQVVSNKRPSEDENITRAKKLKMDERKSEPKEVACGMCDGYLNEIETLKKQLSERDQEILKLREVIVFRAKKEFGF